MTFTTVILDLIGDWGGAVSGRTIAIFARRCQLFSLAGPVR